MTASPKKTVRPTRKNTKSAKTLIWTAALTATFGGWIAMANSSGPSSFFYNSPPPRVSSAQADSQAEAQNSIDTLRVDGAPVYAAQPPAPVTSTRSSR